MVVLEKDFSSFKDYICLKGNDNLKDFRDFYLEGDWLDYYYDKCCFMDEHSFDLRSILGKKLYMDAYLLCGFSKKEIVSMNSLELAKANEKVYDFFGIDDKASDEKVLDVLNYYKKHRYSFGNGFALMIVLTSVLASIVLIVMVLFLRW